MKANRLNKLLNNFLVASSVAAFLLVLSTACQKQTNSFFGNGTTPALKTSSAAIAPAPSDSLKTVLSVSWSNPHYATDSATVKYIIQIDSAGRNFSRAVSFTVKGVLQDSFTAKQINTVALGFGFSFGEAYNMDIRLVSSYSNNNQQLTSNTVTLKYTPYKIPPKVQPPSSGALFLVGDASQGGWSNPVPVPTQQFEKIDSVTYGGVFNLVGGNSYLLLPVNGDWSNKYAVPNGSLAGISAGGSFAAYSSGGDNIPGPATPGLYKIIVSFQQGTFSVIPYNTVQPDSLYLVGDATPGGWSNPVPVPSQKFTRLNASQFQVTIQMVGGKQYLMLPVNGDWSHKFAVADNSIPGLANGGSFGYDLSSNFPGPATDGKYAITADFLFNQFTVVTAH